MWTCGAVKEEMQMACEAVKEGRNDRGGGGRKKWEKVVAGVDGGFGRRSGDS